ncbi:transposase [Flaviaesturariibacter amylovorans]|uniref:transposase n=1 Tax=Flaviaesturariibacter amylovorans TaxID=1084520 RepID=UPI0031EA174C
MAPTLNRSWIHVVWSTKARQPFITPEIERHLYPRLAHHFEKEGCRLLSLNGVADHVQALTGPRLDRPLSEILRKVNGAFAHWMNHHGQCRERFAWPIGFAAISVSPDIVRRVVGYIERQKEHHQKINFGQEWTQFEALDGTSF